MTLWKPSTAVSVKRARFCPPWQTPISQNACQVNIKVRSFQLKNDTNRVGDKLTEVVSGLRTTSRALKNATGEILSGANDLSERTTRQAASIEETSAATEQLDETVRDNTLRAEQAQHSALEASAVAERGGEVMSQANDAMQRITASSNKISDIIGMIDDIAFQTNLWRSTRRSRRHVQEKPAKALLLWPWKFVA